MAQRRMFSKSITNSSQFLMMPEGSQILYFHLGMNADDDGFCEHFTIMRMTNSQPDNLKVLQSKGFVEIFDDKVLIIKDWKENNYIRPDRYTPSRYLEIHKDQPAVISMIGKKLDTIGIPKSNQGDTQASIVKSKVTNSNSTKKKPEIKILEKENGERVALQSN